MKSQATSLAQALLSRLPTPPLQLQPQPQRITGFTVTHQSHGPKRLILILKTNGDQDRSGELQWCYPPEAEAKARQDGQEVCGMTVPEAINTLCPF